MTAAQHVWWPTGQRPVQVVSRADLWGRRVVDAIDLATGTVIRLDKGEITPLASRRWEPDKVVWRAAACRAITAGAAGAAIAAASSGVELLPHQASILARALALEPVRLALCDEVGLGKTITAGAIYTELKARGRASRVLVVAPKSVQLQWVAEFADRFGEEFVRVGADGMPVDAGVIPGMCSPRSFVRWTPSSRSGRARAGESGRSTSTTAVERRQSSRPVGIWSFSTRLIT